MAQSITPPIAQSVLDFWFGNASSVENVSDRFSIWFSSDADFDYDIERRFGKLVSVAKKDGFKAWESEPKSLLALIILLDQFPRNLYRGNPKSFASDTKALALTKTAQTNGFLGSLSPIENGFLLMPYQHSEDLEDQRAGIQAYAALVESSPDEWKPNIEGMKDFAARHLAVIEQFGRFPHRNEILGRESTAEETVYLNSGGERF